MTGMMLGVLVARIYEDCSPCGLAYSLAAALDLDAELIDDLYSINRRQWALEDLSRDPGTAEQLAQVKRKIDVSNGERHRAINAIDERVDVTVIGEGLRFYSETIGELVDRLLILDLKLVASSGSGRDRHVALTDHLAVTVAQLVADVEAGHAVLPRRVGVKIYGGADQ